MNTKASNFRTNIYVFYFKLECNVYSLRRIAINLLLRLNNRTYFSYFYLLAKCSATNVCSYKKHALNIVARKFTTLNSVLKKEKKEERNNTLRDVL